MDHSNRKETLQRDLSGTDEPLCKAAMETDIEDRLVDTVGVGEGGMNWKSSIETYTLPY